MFPAFLSPEPAYAAQSSAAAFAIIDADFASEITIDGEAGDWAEERRLFHGHAGPRQALSISNTPETGHYLLVRAQVLGQDADADTE